MLPPHHINGVTFAYDPWQRQQHYSVQMGEPVVDEIKLEFICEDDLAEQLIGLVKEAGKPSLGWIFMSDIQTTVKIT